MASGDEKRKKGKKKAEKTRKVEEDTTNDEIVPARMRKPSRETDGSTSCAPNSSVVVNEEEKGNKTTSSEAPSEEKKRKKEEKQRKREMQRQTRVEASDEDESTVASGMEMERWKKVISRTAAKKNARKNRDTDSSAMEVIAGTSKRRHSTEASTEETDTVAKKAAKKVLIVQLDREEVDQITAVKEEPTAPRDEGETTAAESISRCYKCHAYGHIAKHCKVEAEICGHCANAGHAHKDCPNKNKNAACVNCKKAGKPSAHASNDRKCPVYIAALERRASQTNYNG
ncbi:uncharacterized protein DDB_G0286299-like [Orussus abietinus]|uniref:uncharacterized protein DDB_G0286299-like n=1 Tax=Orussus abietinus TaxID=222816 RepID=UPI000C7161F5|nr:uncharacterized protein DDB_G0286299-like [Orussus abietinus]